MLEVIEGEIAKLQRAADALRGVSLGRGGRVAGRRQLSTEARARIAAAQRKRWVKLKAAKKAA